MNDDMEYVFNLLQRLKVGTKAQYVRFSTAPYGMQIQVDWDDNCHCVYALGTQEIKSANYEIIEWLIDYFNNQHEVVKVK